MNRIRRKISEMTEEALMGVQGIIPAWGAAWGGLRSRFRSVGNLFWGKQPAYDNTVLNFDLARQFYRNDGADSSLGAAFCKPIIDLQVEFMGIPHASTEDDDMDDRLNECFEIYWADELQQMLRNAMRDSKTVVRIYQDSIADPLITQEEREHCRLEVIDPERVTIQRPLRNKNIIERAVVYHRWLMVDEEGKPEEGILAKTSEHEILEIITPDKVRFFDKTDNVELIELNYINRFGFVPLEEVYNEYDSSLSGGQSDLESVVPLIRALHDVMAQGLMAHKYHSIPKVKFKVKEIEPFIKNNFPSALDENGQLKPGAGISWKGKEVLFFSENEDAEFLEAKSVLGDTKSLIEILFDFICIASHTPEWAFMRVDSGSANSDRNAQTVPFVKKIARKRRGFTRPIQNLCKMYMSINEFTPIRAKLSWEPVRADDQMVLMQALQQLIMGLEVAKQSGVISDRTYQEMIRMFIPMMKNPKQEAKDAESNVILELPPAPGDTANGNGSGSKAKIAAGPQGKGE
jgi:hypothetical protein